MHGVGLAYLPAGAAYADHFQLELLAPRAPPLSEVSQADDERRPSRDTRGETCCQRRACWLAMISGMRVLSIV
jgi:hypothetical protein